MSLHHHRVRALSGDAVDLRDYADKALLVVNVASRCALTPQYSELERLQERYRDRGLLVLGFPCNQFGGQEPGTAQEIETFCSATYGVTFPMFAKVDVNGEDRHPLFEELTQAPDVNGEAGDVQWNFEKFLVAPGAASVTRFRPGTLPGSEELVAAIEQVLPVG